MYARVIPLRRLPRRFTFFDYAVPQNLAIHVGDVVEVTFKGRPLLGVVQAVTQSTEITKPAKVVRVVEPQHLRPADVERLLAMATAIIQSRGSLFLTALAGIERSGGNVPTPKVERGSFRLDPELAQQVQTAVASASAEQPLFVQTSIEGEYALAYGLRKRFHDQILVIAPRGRDADLLSRTVPLGEGTAVLHGKTPLKERGAILRGWRQGTVRTLIGTRQAALLPAQRLSCVHVMDAGSEDHISSERNPRFDARLAAKALARQHGAAFVISGPMPRTEDVAFWRAHASRTPAHQFIDLSSKLEQTKTPFLSETLRKSIENTLQNGKKVLCSFNRTGVAKRLQCAGCGHIPVCATCGAVPGVRDDDLLCTTCGTEMWIPATCPACGASKLTKRGYGNRGIAHTFSRAFPTARVGTVDKRSQDLEADILIATEYFFKTTHQPFAKRQFGTIAELSLDLALGADVRASEQAAYKLHRLLFLAQQQHADCIVQSWLPDITKPMLVPESFLASELEVRQQYHLPPIWGRYQVRCEDQASEIVTRMIEKALPNHVDMLQTADNAFELLTKDTTVAQELLAPLPDSCVITPDIPSYEHPNRATQP